MKREAVKYFSKGDAAEIRYACRVEARYRGQEHGVFALFEMEGDAESFAERFHAAHERAYTFSLPGSPVEITMIHLEAVLHGPIIAIPKLAGADRSLATAFKGYRDVYFGGATGWVSCPVYERTRLPPFEKIAGPLIVEEATATSLVIAGQELEVSEEGLLLIRERDGRSV